MSSILVIQREPMVNIYAADTRLGSHWKPCKDDNSVFLEILGEMCLCGQHSFRLAAEGRKEYEVLIRVMHKKLNLH